MLPLRDYPFAARPMIAAHRGDTTLGAVENSIEAIGAALISGADMIEVDVQWSADEVFVCLHDEVYPKMIAPVHQSSYLDLKKEGVASLIEILELGRGKVYFNIEVKEYSARDPKRFMRSLMELISKMDMDDNVLLSSFRPDFLREAGWKLNVCIIHPDEEMRQLFTSRSFAEPIVLDRPFASYLPSEMMKIARATAYGCHISELNPDALADIEKHNIFLGVYTINTELEFDQAVARGARVLVCEKPQKFAALRNHRFPATATTPVQE